MKNSKSNRWTALGVILILLILSLLLFWPQSSTRTISVAMTGPSGLVIAGHWTVDGVRSDFRTTLPTNFVTTARSLSFEVVRQGDPGIFKIQLAPARTDMGLMSSESEYGIRGDIRFDGDHEDRLLASFGK